jgi:glycosyltransferase involved in cell wall biosynthesis
MNQALDIPLPTLRKLSPEKIMEKYADITTKIFSNVDDAIPVIIPSRDEEYDIPACLAALARSKLRVIPIVVVNCSKDRTYERAKRMGAIVTEINGVKKVGATQHGMKLVLKKILKNNTNRIILFTDADTLVTRNWSQILTDRLKKSLKSNLDSGVAIFGSSIYMHGPSRMADIGQSAHGLIADLRQLVLRSKPLVRGHNYGLGLGSGNIIIDIINKLDPKQVYRDDVALYDNLRKAGVRTLRCLHVRTVVITRGDRAHSFSEFVKNVKDTNYEKSTYDKQYSIEGCPEQEGELS